MGVEDKNLGGNTDDASKEQEPAAVAPTAKVEVKDGKVLVDGKAFVAESHLLAAKHSLEGKLTQAQTAHNTAIDSTKLELSEAQKQIATLNAKVKEVTDASKSGAVSDSDVAKVKQELEASKASMELLKADSAKALEYRRALLVVQFGIAADTIKDKTVAQLDAFEEALKAVSTAKGGVGAYAIGGGSGGAAPQTNMERASKLLAATPVRGTRTADMK